MELIGNRLNGAWPSDLVKRADTDELERVDLAVAYVSRMGEIFDLVAKRRVPMSLYALADGNGLPSSEVVDKFVGSSSAAMRLLLTRDFYHPKIMWFRGVGAYVGSANLSDKAWFRNDECGIWLSHSELEELNWTEQLASMFVAIGKHCREATEEDARALAALRRERKPLEQAESEFRAKVKKFLAGIPGERSRTEASGRWEPGGAARRAFVRQWEEGLTILRKISEFFETQRDRWPKWVDQKVSPSIVQDQATEWWWSADFRHTGESRQQMTEAHERNRANPDAALAELFARWSSFDPGNDDRWSRFVNESPRELYDLLQPERLAQKSEADLARILFLCHASREHGRQIDKTVLGLVPRRSDSDRRADTCVGRIAQ